MKRCCLWISLLAAGMMTGAHAARPVPADFSEAQRWLDRAFGGEAETLPFSFVYGGKPSSELLKSWAGKRDSQLLQDGRTQRVFGYADTSTGLSVNCVATVYADFPAVEWTLHFKNSGLADTPILEQVQALDACFGAGSPPDAFRLRYALGSHESIKDFAPQENDLSAPLRLSPCGGRSSDGVFPFFHLSKAAGGVIVGIGWTGQWAANFEAPASGVARVRAGMELTHLKLHPGEEIRTPAILLMFWSGNEAFRGNNLLRRLLREHYAPKPNGKPVNPPVAASPHAVIGFTDTTEANMIVGIQNVAAHQFPVDTWWIDAGWNGDGDNWARTVGTWTPNATRFPNGLKPVADAAHAKGLRFLLWFEPERVMRDTWLWEHHRDWLSAPDNLPPELQYQKNDGFFLLNLGHPAALAWAKSTLSKMISETGIDIYRQDFNMTPLYFWRKDEARDRQGMNEIRHVTGLYDLFDTLLREHPGLLIDNCASGGRRIDFEIMRRALSLWRSDVCWDALGEQSMNYGISLWYPITGVGAIDMDAYTFRSGLGSNLSLALDYYHQPAIWAPAAGMVRQWQGIRRLFSEDFYPLTPYSLNTDQWIAWQYHDPEAGEGIVQAFRREKSAVGDNTLKFCGLERNRVYSVQDLDAGTRQELSGSVLMDTGLVVHCPAAPGSVLVHYTSTAPADR